jgi:hypothetical protein
MQFLIFLNCKGTCVLTHIEMAKTNPNYVSCPELKKKMYYLVNIFSLKGRFKNLKMKILSLKGLSNYICLSKLCRSLKSFIAG